jgi:hypothetical protein
MSVIFIIATIAAQLTGILVLLIKDMQKNIRYFISLAIISLSLIYNVWTLVLMLTNDFSILSTHRLISSIISVIFYILLFMLMRTLSNKKIKIQSETLIK